MRNTAPFGQIVTRREFLRHSATMFASLCVPKSVARFAEQKLSSNTDYSPVIKTIKQVLSAAMALKDNRSEYSNQGINLAGHVLEVTSRKPFAEFMREELLTPLGMTVSTFDQAKATQNEACALGYFEQAACADLNGIVMPLLAAGGLFASANDLARFIIFHRFASKV